ncbi:ferredoxin--NADP reductase [Skermania piniformis]|uniref:Ferredoxin--NADP reductase n=1 Tax=Skermania pinensis TaxID=39122 RepID=A0ABX8SFF7_9ACTN|nr:ferredoxin--NADP reductase [Skermania piniformis]QXQ15350.1 ferredoxin--NADP reductase [Skermania piniformis]
MNPAPRVLLDEAAPAVPDADGFASLVVERVIRETGDAVSLELLNAAGFRYEAGQYVTLRVTIDGQEHRRCYSMSSSPAAGDSLRVTVKRDRDGVVSNWLNDHARAGDRLDVAAPDGRFTLTETADELVAFAGGSGITPVLSLIHTVLVTTDRRARLFYANRNADSIIFRAALAELAAAWPDRFTAHHHLDDQSGVVTPEQIRDFTNGSAAEYYICGPAPFMDAAESVLQTAGVPGARVHLERFSVEPGPISAIAESAVCEEVTIQLGRKTITTAYRPGTTLLQCARSTGLRAPSSCEVGSCGTCMARIDEGSARMLNNDALDEDEVAEGWVVTCQSLPTSRTVRVVYE